MAPDGKRIAFDTDRDGNFEIYLMDPDGGNLVNITIHPAADQSPSWSPRVCSSYDVAGLAREVHGSGQEAFLGATVKASAAVAIRVSRALRH